MIKIYDLIKSFYFVIVTLLLFFALRCFAFASLNLKGEGQMVATMMLFEGFGAVFLAFLLVLPFIIKDFKNKEKKDGN